MTSSLDERASTRPSVGAWVAAALLVGPVIAVDPWGFAPFGPARWVVVMVIGLAVVAVTLRGQPVVERWSSVAWSVLLGWLLVAAIAGVDPVHVWWGTPERRLGWFTWLLFAALFVAGQQLGAARDLRFVARAAVVATVVIGAWAVLELLDTAPVAVDLADGRVGGPYGQPAYVAATLVLLVPLAVASALDRSEVVPGRAIAAVGALLGSAAILASQTRAAWVAVVTVGLVVAVVRGRSAVRPEVLVAVVAVFAVVLAVPTLRSRAASVVDLDSAGRVDEWRIATATIVDDTVLGAGPEGYRIAVTEHVDAAYAREHGRAVLPDRAHNSVLDVAAIGGVPAAGAFLAVLGVVVVAAIAAIRRSSLLDVGLGAGVLAWTAQGLFLFPLVEVDPIGWLLAGMTVALASRTTWSIGVGSWSVAPMAAALVVVAVVGFGEVRADRDLAAASDALGDGDQRAALAAADRATDRRPDSIRAWFVAARVAAAGGAILDVDAALDRIESGLRASPLDPALRTEHARLLLDRAGRSGSEPDIGRAVAALTELVVDDPNHAEHQLRLGIALALDSRLDAAERALRRAADLTPDADASLVARARMAILAGDIATARAALDELAGSE